MESIDKLLAEAAVSLAKNSDRKDLTLVYKLLAAIQSDFWKEYATKELDKMGLIGE